MTVEISEGALVLELDAERCLKWDGHAAYKNGVGRLPHTNAVDICASVAGDGAVLIEIKDFRGATKPAASDLARAIADKARDTLAGMLWACSRGLSERFHEALVAELLERKKQRVIFWMEENQLDAAAASALQDRIRQELRPHIRADVLVTSSLLETKSSKPLPWLRVRGLPSQRIAQRPRRPSGSRAPKKR